MESFQDQSQWQHGQEFGPRMGRSVSIERAAELLGVSRRTVYNRITDGRLDTIRTLGGSQRIVVDSLRHLLRTYRRLPVSPDGVPDGDSIRVA